MTIHYTPLAAVDGLTNPGDPVPKIYVKRFADVRKDPNAIGGNQNIYGGNVNTVRTSDDVGLIIGEAVTDALKKSGALADFRSERQPTDNIPAAERRGYDAVLGGEITLIDVTSKPGWNTVDATARVVIRVSVTRDGKSEWVGPIEGTAKQGTLSTDITNAMSQALDGAIQNCMRAMIQHLRASGALTSKT
jgi:hypothetical protein